MAEAALTAIAEKIFRIPKSVDAFRKIRKVYEDRQNRFQQRTQFDWAMGEALAYGTLLNEGVPIRLSGQDCERGTFSHRHAVVVGEETEAEYIPLNNISKNQEKFTVYNSPSPNTVFWGLNTVTPRLSRRA